MGGMGESVARLTESGFNPTWSPDGTEILFASEGVFDPRNRSTVSQLLAVRIDTRQTRMVFDAADAVQPDWSPNGHRIAFWGLREESGQRDIWTIPAAGGEPVSVTEDTPTDWNPVWSPDGKFLYFSSDRSGSFNIWRVPIDEQTGAVTGEMQAVTTGSADSGAMSISDDGRRIAYFEDRSSNNLQKVAFDPARGELAGEPEWVTRGSIIMNEIAVSPDGEWIAYYPSAAKEDLFLARTDGTGRRQLTDDPYKARDPDWSPDGSRIAFFSDRNGSYQIFTIQPDGRGLRQITDLPEKLVATPMWSPDGSRMGFYYGNAYFIIHLGPAPKDLELEPLPPWDGEDGVFEVADWSPDSRLLAGNLHSLVGGRGFRFEGFGIHDLETGEYEKLLDKEDLPPDGVNAVWLADNRRLIYSNESRVYILDRKTRESREIFHTDREWVDVTDISSDNRTLYWTRYTNDGDVWMLELE